MIEKVKDLCSQKITIKELVDYPGISSGSFETEQKIYFWERNKSIISRFTMNNSKSRHVMQIVRGEQLIYPK